MEAEAGVARILEGPVEAVAIRLYAEHLDHLAFAVNEDLPPHTCLLRRFSHHVGNLRAMRVLLLHTTHYVFIIPYYLILFTWHISPVPYLMLYELPLTRHARVTYNLLLLHITQYLFIIPYY
jgi:hypothetical protein